jgi:hypothetical protein
LYADFGKKEEEEGSNRPVLRNPETREEIVLNS